MGAVGLLDLGAAFVFGSGCLALVYIFLVVFVILLLFIYLFFFLLECCFSRGFGDGSCLRRGSGGSRAGAGTWGWSRGRIRACPSVLGTRSAAAREQPLCSPLLPPYPKKLLPSPFVSAGLALPPLPQRGCSLRSP